MAPSPRRIEVARAYVDGLERKAALADGLSAQMVELNWEAINMAAHSLTMYRLLSEIVTYFDIAGWPNTNLDAVAHEVLDNTLVMIDQAWSCPCGHSKYDHDKLGCMYLGCRSICGVQR